MNPGSKLQGHRYSVLQACHNPKPPGADALYGDYRVHLPACSRLWDAEAEFSENIFDGSNFGATRLEPK